MSPELESACLLSELGQQHERTRGLVIVRRIDRERTQGRVIAGQIVHRARRREGAHVITDREAERDQLLGCDVSER